MINNVIPIRITEDNMNKCLNSLVLRSPGPGLESSAFEIQSIQEVKLHSEIRLMRGKSSK